VVFFIRHGQGLHNLGEIESKLNKCNRLDRHTGNCAGIPEHLFDPDLSKLGMEQTRALKKITSSLELQPELVLVSPMRRAIKTAINGFSHLISEEGTSKVPFIATINAREKSGRNMWDKRKPLSLMKEEFPLVDFSTLKAEEDPLWTVERESNEQVAARAHQLIEEIFERKERVIAVASHSGLLKQLFNNVLDIDEEGWKEVFNTAEMRMVCLLPSEENRLS